MIVDITTLEQADAALKKHHDLIGKQMSRLNQLDLKEHGRVPKLEQASEDHDKRIRDMEITLAKIGTKVAIGTTVGAMVGSAVIAALFKFFGG